MKTDIDKLIDNSTSSIKMYIGMLYKNKLIAIKNRIK